MELPKSEAIKSLVRASNGHFVLHQASDPSVFAELTVVVDGKLLTKRILSEPSGSLILKSLMF
jgi:hypothetical protein